MVSLKAMYSRLSRLAKGLRVFATWSFVALTEEELREARTQYKYNRELDVINHETHKSMR